MAADATATATAPAKLAPNKDAGADVGKYFWTQRLADVTVTIPVPPGTRGRDVVCKITEKTLSVKVRGATVVEGTLHRGVKASECFWNVVDQKSIVVELQKLNAMEWWGGVIVGDPEIDTTKVQPEDSRLGDLDGDTRRMVEKMMYDQRMKMQGLPTSEEQERAQVLERFKAAHPEMDFSHAQVQQ